MQSQREERKLNQKNKAKLKKQLLLSLKRIGTVGCNDCGLDYGGDSWIEAVIPHKIWNKIKPDGDGAGLLCITCISTRLKKAGFKDVPVWLSGMEPLKAMPEFGDSPEDWEAKRKVLCEWDYVIKPKGKHHAKPRRKNNNSTSS